MKLSIATAALVVAATSPVFAADLVLPVQEAAPVAYAHDWSGFYAGIVGGYSSGRTTATRNLGGTVDTVDPSGGLIGGTLGANAQFDNFVLGVEGDLMWSGASGDVACALAPANTCSMDMDWLGTLRARAGIAVDQVLFYATGGVAFASINGNVTTPAGGSVGSFDDTFIGWTLGAGVELAMTDNLSLKAEYNYIDLGTKTAPLGTLSALSTYDIHPTTHVVKVGLNYKF